jgi:two-component system response regulator YesN
MNKASIFLVDDEQPVLDGLSVTIQKAFPDLKICGTARSGIEALEGIAAEKPDIIIMDVRMPGMSGIDTLREVNKILPDTVSILLTAYERFDIAQEAYVLGVYKYLVKPVAQEVLTETINGALERLNAIKASAFKIVSERERFESTRPLLETGFIYTAIMGEPQSPLLRSYAELLGLIKDSDIRGHFAAIYKTNIPGYQHIWLREEEVEHIRREVTNRLDCVMGSLLGGVIPIFVGDDKFYRTRDALKDAIAVINNPTLMYSIGSVQSGANLRVSWSEAMDFVREENTPGEAKESKAQTPDSSVPEKQAILDAMKAGDMQTMRKAFTRWVLHEQEPAKKTVDRALMAGALAALAGGSAEDILAAGQAQMVIGDTTHQEIADHATYMLIFSLSSISAPDENRYFHVDKRIRMVLQFIAEHYAEPVSLEDAAEQVGLSPAHLSRLLSTETGTTFSDHLSGRRIDRACKELTEGCHSIKEISVLCGYPDANYFSRAFKKTIGITPSEYAQKQGRNIL